jgi:hypothetical protein
MLAAGLLLATSRPLLAGSPAAAEAAAAAVLFELDIENASYKVRRDGHLDILFGPSVPAERYRQALDALHAHPDISGVLAGRGSADFCPSP